MFNLQVTSGKAYGLIYKGNVYLTKENADHLDLSIEGKQVQGYLEYPNEKIALYDFNEETEPWTNGSEREKNGILTAMEWKKLSKKEQDGYFLFGYAYAGDFLIEHTFAPNRYPNSWIHPNEAEGLDLPSYTFKEFNKMMKEEKKAFVSAKNAKELGHPVTDSEMPVAYREYTKQEGPFTYHALYDRSHVITVIDRKENDKFCIDKKTYKTLDEEWKEKYKFKGHIFKRGIIQPVYSIESYCKKEGITFQTDKNGLLDSHKFYYHPRLIEDKKPNAYFFESGRISSYFDPISLFKELKIPFYQKENDISAPLFSKEKLSSMKKEFYQNREVGYALNYASWIIAVFNLEEICKENNWKYISQEEFMEKEYFLYFRKASNLFPKKWNVKEKMITTAYTNEAVELMSFPGGTKQFFGVVEKTTSDIVVSFNKFESLKRKARKEKIDFGNYYPKGVTENNELVFDTTGKKELRMFGQKLLTGTL